MKNFLTKSMALKGGLLMSALTVGVIGFSSSNAKMVNNEATISLRGASRSASFAAFETRDANALVASSSANCSENSSGCSVTYNGTKTTIKGKKE